MQTGCRQFCWDDFGEILHVTELLDKTRAIRAGEELDLARLEPYLRSHLPDAAGPLVVEQFPAGHSNLTYSVRIGPLDMVLRRPPFGSKVKSARHGREYRVLSKLHKAFARPAAGSVLR